MFLQQFLLRGGPFLDGSLVGCVQLVSQRLLVLFQFLRERLRHVFGLLLAFLHRDLFRFGIHLGCLLAIGCGIQRDAALLRCLPLLPIQRRFQHGP